MQKNHTCSSILPAVTRVCGLRPPRSCFVVDYVGILDRFVSILFPQRCAFCGEVVAYDDFWCGKCGEDGNAPYARLGRADCEFPYNFSEALAALEYAGKVRDSIWLLKDKADRRALRFFVGEMRAVMVEYWSGVRFELVVPVPSAASKLKERGFNPAEMLARQVSGDIGILMREDVLVRRELSRDQRGLTAAERRVNAEKSYDVGNPAGVESKTVLLVDDVFTTGSTVSACTDKLLDSGAVGVYVLAAAAVKKELSP